MTSLLVAGTLLVGAVPRARDRSGTPEVPVGPALDRMLENRPPHGRARPALASWYGAWHQGRPTASGEAYDIEAFTAAHPSVPLGTCLEVVHLANGRRVFVRVNDRGPYVGDRTIDLSYRAAQELDIVEAGLAPVRIRKARTQACETITG
jgi:rare lipoprotein A